MSPPFARRRDSVRIDFSAPPPPAPRDIELYLPPAAALAAAARAAEEWGSELKLEGGGGRLLLPVVAGIRRGTISGRLAAEALAGGCRLRFTPEESAYYVHTPSVAVLLISALGALLTIAWPIYPRLLPVAPLGAVLALCGWFLVVSRLRNSGPEEYLDTVAALAEEGNPGTS